MNETKPVQKQDIDRIVRVLEQILAELKQLRGGFTSVLNVKQKRE